MDSVDNLADQLMARFRQGLRSPFGPRRLTDALMDAADLIEAARRGGASWAQIADVLSAALRQAGRGEKLDEATVRGLVRRVRLRQDARRPSAPASVQPWTPEAPRPQAPALQKEPPAPEPARPEKSDEPAAARGPPNDRQTKAERIALDLDRLSQITRAGFNQDDAGTQIDQVCRRI
jgi:hypothetical protein